MPSSLAKAPAFVRWSRARAIGGPLPRRPLGWVVALLLAVALLAVVVLPGSALASTEELKAEIADTEAQLKTLLGDKTTSQSDVLRARVRLGRLYAQIGPRKKAEAQWQEVVKTFAKGAWPRDGGAEATSAAAASFWLLEGRYLATRSTIPAPNPKLSGKKQMDALLAQVRTLRQSVLGEEVTRGEGDNAVIERKGGLLQDYAVVATFGAAEWQVAASLYQSRLLQHLAEILPEVVLPADLAPEAAEQWRAAANEQAASFLSQATRLLDEAWATAQRRASDSDWALEVRRDLNKFFPDRHPLSRERSREVLDPQPPAALLEALGRPGGLDAVRACYDRRLAHQPDEMLADVVVRLTVTAEGTIGELKVDGDDVAVPTCLRKKWRTLKDLPAGPFEVGVKMQFAAL